MHTPESRRIKQRIEENMEAIFQIAHWLQLYPNCHPELRLEKLELWKDLEQENELLEKRMDACFTKWRRERMGRPASVGEVAADVMRALSGDFE